MKLNIRCIVRFSVIVKDLIDDSLGQHTKINFPPAVLLLLTQPSVSSSFSDHICTQGSTVPSGLAGTQAISVSCEGTDLLPSVLPTHF